MPVDADKLMQDKRIVAWAAWFVSDDWKLLRFNSDEHTGEDLPTDGFLCAKLRHDCHGKIDVEGYYGPAGRVINSQENISGSGWIVFLQTDAGLIFQSTGDNSPPSPVRYPGAKFIKDKLAPSALLHVAFEEAAQWR